LVDCRHLFVSLAKALETRLLRRPGFFQNSLSISQRRSGPPHRATRSLSGTGQVSNLRTWHSVGQWYFGPLIVSTTNRNMDEAKPLLQLRFSAETP
jgi:hypothetical protein